jgi:hypothetical protein
MNLMLLLSILSANPFVPDSIFNAFFGKCEYRITHKPLKLKDDKFVVQISLATISAGKTSRKINWKLALRLTFWHYGATRKLPFHFSGWKPAILEKGR